jgi:SAM-dependent methyltransferase
MWRFVRDLPLLLRLGRTGLALEESLWVRAALRSGLFELLARGSAGAEAVARELGGPPELTLAFLNAGVACGWVVERSGRFALPRRVRRLVRQPTLQAVALYQSEVRERSLRLAPELLRGALPPALDAAAGHTIARLSSLGAPLAARILRRLPGLDAHGARFLDAGCGAAEHLIELAGRFPRSHCLGIDRDPEVVALATDNVQRAGVAGRVLVRPGDVRGAPLDPPHQLALLSQVLHYLAPAERPAVVQRLAEALEPGGFLAVEQFVRLPGRSAGRFFRFFELFLASHPGLSQLPEAAEVEALLAGAGLELLPRRRLAGVRGLYLFIGRRPRVLDSAA